MGTKNRARTFYYPGHIFDVKKKKCLPKLLPSKKTIMYSPKVGGKNDAPEKCAHHIPPPPPPSSLHLKTMMVYSSVTVALRTPDYKTYIIKQSSRVCRIWIIIHRMQVWRTARLSPGTSRMQARLVRLWCFVLTEKSCFAVDLVCSCFALPINCCVPECHQKALKSFTAEKVFFFFFVSAVASQGK